MTEQRVKNEQDSTGETAQKLEESLKEISESFRSERTIGTPLTELQRQEFLDLVTQMLRLDSGAWSDATAEFGRIVET